MTDVVASVMKVKSLMKAAIKIYDLFVSNGDNDIFLQTQPHSLLWWWWKEVFVEKKLMKPNLNRMSHLQRRVNFYHLIQTSDLHHMKQGRNKVKFCHKKKMLMRMCKKKNGIDNGTQCNLIYEFNAHLTFQPLLNP